MGGVLGAGTAEASPALPGALNATQLEMQRDGMLWMGNTTSLLLPPPEAAGSLWGSSAAAVGSGDPVSSSGTWAKAYLRDLLLKSRPFFCLCSFYSPKLGLPRRPPTCSSSDPVFIPSEQRQHGGQGSRNKWDFLPG